MGPPLVQRPNAKSVQLNGGFSLNKMQASDSSYLCPVFLASTLKSDNVLLGTSKDRMCPITSIHSLNAEGRCYLHVWIRYNRYQNHKNLALRAIELLLNLLSEQLWMEVFEIFSMA